MLYKPNHQKYFIPLYVFWAALGILLSSHSWNSVTAAPQLLSHNTEVPFCYLAGGTRRWPILDGDLTDATPIELIARQDSVILGRGTKLELPGIDIRINNKGFLIIDATTVEQNIRFELEIRLNSNGESSKHQTILIQPAPPPRPISYIADLVDDLIRIFWNSEAGHFRPVTKYAFGPYFRRLQAHGCQRLIVWQSPFPYMSDPDEFAAPDWLRYVSQSQAILNKLELRTRMQQTPGLQSWEWLSEMMSLRLMPEFGPLFSQSAQTHGISLTASFRPFEHALAKYYEVPTFDTQWDYVGGFSPLASPIVNYHSDKVGFASYREILTRMGNIKAVTLDKMVLTGVRDAEKLVSRFKEGKQDFTILASRFPPIDSRTWVLVEHAQDQFDLRSFGSVREAVRARLHRISNFQLSVTQSGTLQFTGLQLPEDCHVITLEANSPFARSLVLPVDIDIKLFAKTGNRMGRANIYWVMDESVGSGRETHIGGILETGDYRASYQAIDNSINQMLDLSSSSHTWKNNRIVVNLGRRWASEMVDFNLPAARKYVLKQLRTLLRYPAFDEIFINTRSHTQLASTSGDSLQGLGTVFHFRSKGYTSTGYRLDKQNHIRLGIDRAYIPRDAADAPLLRETVSRPETLEKLTHWQNGEWNGTCQSPDDGAIWRYQRNVEIAQGVRQLLVDIQQNFPGYRTRVVIPHRARVDHQMEKELASMKQPDGTLYGSDWFRHIWSTNNHIPVIGEGMSMINLEGLRVEPVFLGIRFAPDQDPLKSFVTQCMIDMADNHGSEFQGAKSFIYEAQETLRSNYREKFSSRRESIIRYLLSQKKSIREVILYEAADWLYGLPVENPYRYLDVALPDLDP